MSGFSRFDRVVLGVMACLVIVLGGVWGVWQVAGVPLPQAPEPDQAVGARGPLGIRFGLPVDQADAEEHIHFEPALEGSYTWADDTAYFWPLDPLQVGQVYTVRIEPGVKTADRRVIRREAVWQVQVRSPQVVYLALGSAELWRVDPQSGAAEELTDTGGRVYDYAVSPDGEQLVFSQYDDQKGVSLWSIPTGGGEASLLLDCGADWCVNPVFSPDGQQLAYARQLAGITEGSAPGVPRIWTFDLRSMQTSRMYSDPNIGGSEPVWSPDGSYLAFYDGITHGLRLANLADHQDNLLPSEMGMTGRWSPDGADLFFTDIVIEETYAYEMVYRYNLPTRQLSRALGEDVLPLDYSPVALSPDGQWLVVGIREVSGHPARQMWLMHTDGSQRQQITQDPLVNTGAYEWSPGNDQVVYQALELGSSSASPQIMLWDRTSGETRRLAESASQPAWIP